DLNYDITGNVTLGLAQKPNTLSSATYVDWHIHDKGDLVKCALVVGFELGVLTYFSAGLFGFGALSAFGGAFGFLVGFVGVLTIAAFYAPGIPAPSCVQISDHQLNCTYPLQLNFGNTPGRTTQASFVSLTGATDGLVLGGGLTAPSGILSVQVRLGLAGKTLNVQGLRSLQSPMSSLRSYLNALPL